MKSQRCDWVFVAAIFLIGVLGTSEGNAFGPRRVYVAPAPSYYYNYPSYYYSYYPSAYGYPYFMPLPSYGVLPMSFAAPNWGYGYDYSRYGVRPVVDGYVRDPLQPAPRARSPLYPAVPFQASSDGAQAEGRRVRFEITVPYADATVTFDGAATKQTGLNRVFVTPPMGEGKEYTVTIAVQWTKQDGTKSAPRQKNFTVKAGQTIQHTFVE